jgi:hypothetical protein
MIIIHDVSDKNWDTGSCGSRGTVSAMGVRSP